MLIFFRCLKYVLAALYIHSSTPWPGPICWSFTGLSLTGNHSHSHLESLDCGQKLRQTEEEQQLPS